MSAVVVIVILGLFSCSFFCVTSVICVDIVTALEAVPNFTKKLSVFLLF